MHVRVLAVMAVVAWITTVGADETMDEEIVYATVEGCGGCQLNKFPQVKKFINEDLPYYDNVKYVLVPNSFPAIVYRNKHKEEIDRVFIRYMSQEECNDLLLERGFIRNEKPKATPKPPDEDEKTMEIIKSAMEKLQYAPKGHQQKEKEKVSKDSQHAPERSQPSTEKIQLESEETQQASEETQEAPIVDKPKDEL